jgi:hypothetical protein
VGFRLARRAAGAGGASGRCCGVSVELEDG